MKKIFDSHDFYKDLHLFLRTEYNFDTWGDVCNLKEKLAVAHLYL